jgi:hypothetical protein
VARGRNKDQHVPSGNDSLTSLEAFRERRMAMSRKENLVEPTYRQIGRRLR